MIPVVMSGGSGTRLWPVSRAEFPKQFCELFAESLQTLTLKRLIPLGSPWTLTTKSLKVLTEKTLAELKIANNQVIYEPQGRNTAPAIALTCFIFQTKGWGEQVAGIFPADQLVEDVAGFNRAVRLAEQCALAGEIVTLGIKPTYPATGYGYIETRSDVFKKENQDQAFWAKRFCEKPDLRTAQTFIDAGNYFWNAGMFVFQVKVMCEKLGKHTPEVWREISALKDDLSNLDEIYQRVEKISIDYGVMEKLEKLICIPADIGWSDVGSWEEMAKFKSTESSEKIEESSLRNYVYSKEKKSYGLVGVEDLLVVDTADALLIAKNGQSQNVKKVVETLEKQKKTQAREHVFTHRPWGKYEILRDTELFKSKVITVEPGQRLSYQSHNKRAEHWIVVAGYGEVTLNDQVRKVAHGDYIFIPLKAKHRIACTGAKPLQFVEVQVGEYFGEDDIIRYQDDYNR